MTKKLEIVDQETISILEHVADLMKLEANEQNQLLDFKPGDIVKSSILQGLYKVCFIAKDSVLVGKIDMSSPIYPIHPKYLKKVDINRKTVDILYNGKA